MSEEPASKQYAADDAIELAVRQLDREWGEALLGNDIVALDRILPASFIFTDPDSDVLSRDEFIELIKIGELKFESLRREDVKLSVHLNTASATGRDEVKARYKGRDVSGQYRFTNVYVEQGGRWKVVSSQVSRVTGLVE